MRNKKLIDDILNGSQNAFELLDVIVKNRRRYGYGPSFDLEDFNYIESRFQTEGATNPNLSWLRIQTRLDGTFRPDNAPLWNPVRELQTVIEEHQHAWSKTTLAKIYFGDYVVQGQNHNLPEAERLLAEAIAEKDPEAMIYQANRNMFAYNLNPVLNLDRLEQAKKLLDDAITAGSYYKAIVKRLVIYNKLEPEAIDFLTASQLGRKLSMYYSALLRETLDNIGVREVLNHSRAIFESLVRKSKRDQSNALACATGQYHFSFYVKKHAQEILEKEIAPGLLDRTLRIGNYYPDKYLDLFCQDPLFSKNEKIEILKYLLTHYSDIIFKLELEPQTLNYLGQTLILLVNDELTSNPRKISGEKNPKELQIDVLTRANRWLIQVPRQSPEVGTAAYALGQNTFKIMTLQGKSFDIAYSTAEPFFVEMVRRHDVDGVENLIAMLIGAKQDQLTTLKSYTEFACTFARNNMLAFNIFAQKNQAANALYNPLTWTDWVNKLSAEHQEFVIEATDRYLRKTIQAVLIESIQQLYQTKSIFDQGAKGKMVTYKALIAELDNLPSNLDSILPFVDKAAKVPEVAKSLASKLRTTEDGVRQGIPALREVYTTAITRPLPSQPLIRNAGP